MAKAKWNVKSYVMFDTETTGLQSPGNKPRITELCFIALTREEILTRQREPRVINKLSLCVNPENKKIHHQSSEITGLYNDSLFYQAIFKEQADLVISFLQSLPQPACLVAHNGHRFDFPLLMAELRKCKKELCEGILCADTLEAFRSFDGLPSVPDYVLERERNTKRVMSLPDPNISSVACIKQNVEANIKTLQCKKRRTECLDGIDIRNMKEQKIDSLQQIKLLSQNSITDSERDMLEACEEEEKRLPQLTCNQKSEMQHSEGSKPVPVQNIDMKVDTSKEQKIDSLQQRNETTPDQKTLKFYSQSIHKKSQDSDLPQNNSVRKNLFPKPQLTLKSNIEKEDITKIEYQSNSSQCRNSEADLELESCGEMKLLSQNSITDSERDLLEACEEEEKRLPQLTCNQKSEMQHSEGSKPVPVQNIDMKVDTSKNKPSKGKVQKSYRLGNLYADCFGQRPEVVHFAEEDCKILLKLIIFQLKEFIPYCDSNAVLFSDIEPMY